MTHRLAPIAAALLLPALAAAEEAPDLTRYLQTGTNAALIAAAVAQVDDCPVPLSFTETPDAGREDRVVLSIGCGDTADPHAMLVFFGVSPDGALWFDEMFPIP
jgi:hypothetical protein